MFPLRLRSLFVALALLLPAVGPNALARPFVVAGSAFNLTDVTSNVDVYFTAMRYNRAANEWDVNVTLSNKVGQAQSGPLLLVVDSFSGTSGPLHPDGVSSNEPYFDMTPELAQGQLVIAQPSSPRVVSFGFTAGASPHITTSVYALVSTNLGRAVAFVQTQDQTGSPLPGVSVMEAGPNGMASYTTDPTWGVATLGSVSGTYAWMFSASGYLPVWRQAQLESNVVTVIPYPRLAAISTETNSFSPLVASDITNEVFQGHFAAGSFSRNSSAQITPLDSESLPFSLPQGWSPLQAFAIQFSSAPAQALSVQLNPWGFISPNEQAAFVQFNQALLNWQTLQVISGNGTNAVTALLPGNGTFALVVGDSSPIAPPVAVAGEVLAPSAVAAPSPTNLSANSSVTPTTSPASTVPAAVTAVAQVTVTNLAEPLPSGEWFRGEVSQIFDLVDGSIRTPQIFDTYFTGYQRPVSIGQGILQGQFQIRPSLTLDASQLNQGTVHMDVFPADSFSGGLLDTNGGAIGQSPVEVLASAGAVARPEAIELRAVSPSNFANLPGTGFVVAAAFEVAVTGVSSNQPLAIQISGVTTNTNFVLGQVIDQGILYGVTPLARLHSDANGNLFDDETNSDRLPGLTGSGQFVLLEAPGQEGLIDGVAENASAQPTNGIPVSVSGLPWLVISGPGGAFKTLAPAGPQTVSATNTLTGDSGTAPVSIPADFSTVNVTVSAGAVPLLVTSVSPSDEASNVPQITPIVVNFSRPVAAGLFETNSVMLIENSNEVVVASASLNLAGTTATLLTEDQLDLGALFQIVVASNLTDDVGRPITGQTTFAFQTAEAATRDPAAQLIIYQPGATNLPTNLVTQLPGYVGGSNSAQIVVQGTPGCADPDDAVVIIDETSGITTTVTAQDDGSFVSFINGQAQDYIAATFFSQNGARLYVPVNRQVFDDGSVGLYQQGGALTATGDGGPVVVTVPPNAISGRTVFKLTSITTNELSMELGGVTPTNAVVAGSALKITTTGAALALPVQASFPVNLTNLGYPTNEAPTNCAAVLAIVSSNQNVTAFQVVDQLTFTPQTNASPQNQFGSIRTHRPRNPRVGTTPPPQPRGYDQVAAGFLNTSVGTAIGALGGPGLAATIAFNQIIVPLLIGASPCTVKGKVAAIPYNLAVSLANAGIINQVVSLQTGISYIDVPVQCLQLLGKVNLGLPIQLAQQAYQVNYQVFQLDVQNTAAPLSGAFITLTLAGGPLNQEPGRLYPGMVYATSDERGNFLMVAPAAGVNYVATASHPLYAGFQTQSVQPINYLPGQQGEIGLAGIVYKNFFFANPNPAVTTPTVSLANQPVLPGANVPCQIVVSATAIGGPPVIKVGVVGLGTTNILTGLPDTKGQYTLTGANSTSTGNGTQWTGTLTVSEPVIAKLTVAVQPPVGVGTVIPYVISFSGPVPVTSSPTIPPPDTNDVHGPVVMETLPPANGYVDSSDTVQVIFNKPIDPSVTNNLGGIVLSAINNSAVSGIIPIVRLSADQQTLLLSFPGLQQGSTYNLTLSGQSIRDLAGKPLDQIPSTTVADSFTTSFRTSPQVTINIPNIASGRGAVISGTQLYAIDQAPNGNYLDAYDISNPQTPILESQISLVGIPRDIVVIPQYHYQLTVHPPIYTNDLVAVVGGNLDAIINQAQGVTVTEPGQYLWVVNMGNPAAPQVLASPKVSYRVGSAVTKVRWAPPYLAYEEYGSDIQLIGLVNLQEMIIGFNSTALQQLAFTNGRPGVDLLGDGTYTDPGDTLPLPPEFPVTFFGNDQNYIIQGSTQGILDFSVTPGARTIGVTLQSGDTLNTNGVAVGPLLPPMYRTLVYNGRPALNIASPTDAGLAFPGAYPRWVTCFDVLPILSNGAPTTISAALVSLEPDANGNQSLAVVNISFPQTPTLLNTISIPTSVLGGNIESVVLRSDGLLEVAGQQNVVLLNPLYLSTPATLGQLSPAITGVIPNAGTAMRSLGLTSYGVQAVADNGRAELVVSSPQLQFVSFPNIPVFDPSTLIGSPDSAIAAVISNKNSLSALAPAAVNNLVVNGQTLNQSDMTPPNSSLHYYVLMNAPGASGYEVDLGLESLNQSGRPLSNLGYGFAPVRAESLYTQQLLGQTPLPCGAPIQSIPAYRLSSNPNSPYYNYYLSRPFALVTESLDTTQLATLRVSPGFTREILFSGAQMRAFIEPNQSANPLIGTFAGQVDPNAQVVYPIATTIAPTQNRDYLIGGNPPAPGGSSPFENTYNTIQAHSGELRTSDADMGLPSPRMPINFTRTIGNQDNYWGPFGAGWDFNYNQRLTILDPLTFPAGLQMPMVVRDNAGDSDIAGSQDILFNNGVGQIYHFAWQGTNMPDVYQQDPLVKQNNYAGLVSDYYLPTRGCFDLLVKFKDGRFERMTPDGFRYRYTSSGRLEYIIDRFPNNWQYMTYDRNGWLTEIDDASVASARNIKIGYYRSSTTDPDYSSIDITASSPSLVGKIYQLVDYTGRNVIFSYDPNGLLIEKDGIEVDGENNGYLGRLHINYGWQNCKLESVTATKAGIPYVQANNAFNSAGAPVAQQTSGSSGVNQMTVPQNNTAATTANEQTGVKTPDGTSITHKFDKWGNPTQTTITGSDGTVATETMTWTEDSLMTYKQFPEGNSETMVFDSSNPIFRSRGNLLSRRVDPGPRLGPTYTETYSYDPTYNLQSGPQVNADGFTINYTLTSDARAVASIDYGTAGTKTMAYNDNGQVTSVTDENGLVKGTDFDPDTGFVLDQTAGGIEYDYGYDSSIASQLGRPASISPPTGAPTTFLYNNNLQQVEIDRGELTGTSGYDELGRAIYADTKLGDGTEWTRTQAYDNKSFLINMTLNGIEVDGSVSSLSTLYTSDSQGRLATVTDPNGTVQTYTYDARGNVIQSQIGDYINTFTYDLNNNPLTELHAGSLIRTVQYDGLDHATNVIYHTDAGDYSETRSFYPGGAIASDKTTDPTYGVVKNFTYDGIDALGRHLSTTIHGNQISPQYLSTYAPLNTSVKGPFMTYTTTYDTAGNEVGYNDPNETTVFQRDPDDRVQEADHHQVGATYSQFFTYDGLDHETSLSDLQGARFTYVPRGDGNVTQTTDALKNSVSQTYSSIGEITSRTRADGMETVFRHNQERQLDYQGDPGAGNTFGFDNDLRMTQRTQRDGSAVTYAEFDPNNMPTKITLPGGGTETCQYDLQRRLLQRKVTYQATDWEENFTYDAVGRVRTETYTQNGGPDNSATFDYDPAGFLLSAQFNEDDATYKVGYQYYSDGTLNKLTYPSGVVVTEYRDSTGRLTGLADGNGNIISAESWQGNTEPKVVTLGTSMTVTNQYDKRGRQIANIVSRNSDGAILSHMVYQYDLANNPQIREYLHRGGIADEFQYDTGERISQANVQVRVTNSAGAGPSLYQRSYNYHQGGLDYLTSVTLTGPTNAPPFGSNWTSHDDFLQPTVLDAFNRGEADYMGNVAGAKLWTRPAGANAPQHVAADIEHDGLGHLVSLTLTNGIEVDNEFQPGDLRFGRTVTQNGEVVSSSAYVYDNQMRLLEEYDRTGAEPVLVGRYYYGNSDAPIAGDILNTNTGVLQRYYYIKDNSQSIIGVVDSKGTNVERVWYDPFGQPVITTPSPSGPAVTQVAAGASGSLLIGLSEAVSSPWSDPGASASVSGFNNTIPQSITAKYASTGTPLAGTVTLLNSAPGFAPFSVLQFTPTTPTTNAIVVSLVAGTLADEWGNTNAAWSKDVTNSQPQGTVYYQLGSYSGGQVARSSIGSPFLFQGQYFDYDTGLLYLRARFYDPYAGMFMEPDPMGYADSVNPYASFGNNPAKLRDPSGLFFTEEAKAAYAEHGVHPMVIEMASAFQHEAARVGIAANELVTILQGPLMKAIKENTPVELIFRSFKNNEVRVLNAEMGFQGKPMWVYLKTDPLTGLTKATGRWGEHPYNSDIDFVMITVNGEPTEIGHFNSFKESANATHLELNNLFKAARERAGQSIIEGESQLMVMHGASLYLPFERAIGGLGSPESQTAVYHAIETKMKSGIGECASIGFDPKRGLYVNENVDITEITSKTADLAREVLLTPDSPKFNAELARGWKRAAGWENDKSGLLFPSTFMRSQQGGVR